MKNPQSSIALNERDQIMTKIKGLETEINMDNEKLKKMEQDIKKFSFEYTTKLHSIATGLTNSTQIHNTVKAQTSTGGDQFNNHKNDAIENLKDVQLIHKISP